MRIRVLAVLVCSPLMAADPALKPVTVCEVLQDLPAFNGKAVAVVGRLSFRQTGRWLGEQKCPHALVIGGHEWPNALWITYDPAAPTPPDVLAVDAPMLAQKLRAVQLDTSLGEIRFGSPDYDRWAVVYGRVETRKDLVSPAADGAHKNGYGYGASSPARLVCHGEALVVFLNDDATMPASR